MRRPFVGRLRAAVESLPSAAFTAVLLGAWLALTVLFTVVGVSLVGTVATALGNPQGVGTFLVTLAGAVGACAVAPILARTVVAEAVERVVRYAETDGDLALAGTLPSLCEMKGWDSCRSRRRHCC